MKGLSMHLRRFLFILFACSIGPPLIAQSTGPFVITSTSSPCASITTSDRYATVGIQVAGTFSATLQPEVSIQGQAAVNTKVTPVGSLTAQSTITAAGAFQGSVAGMTTFFVCPTAYVSGTATIYLNVSSATSTSLFQTAATPPGGAANAIQYSTGSAFSGLTAPATNCVWNVIYNVTASATVAPSTGCPGVTVNTPATPYTLLYSDRATYQRLTGGSTFAFTLCQITGTCASNLPFVVQNGNSGLLTFTANAADKIDNSATGGTSTLLSNFAAFVYQDSSSAPGNWWTLKFPTFSAFGTTCANALTWSTSTGFGCSGTLGGSTTVNGAGAATNLSDSTPAAPSNGINVKCQISGANASCALVGDGNAAHYPDGTGVYSTPAGAANLYAWWSPATGTVGDGSAAVNITRIWGFTIPLSISSTGICYSVGTADNTANLYDVGVFNSSGTLLVHTGAIAGSTSFNPAAQHCVAWTGTATIPAGKNYIGRTSNAGAGAFGSSTLGNFASAVNATGGTTSGGTLAGPLTPPADSWASGVMINFSLH